MAHTPSTWKGKKYLAVGRANGDIELWSFNGKYVLERNIPGPKGLSLETLVWSHQVELTAEDKELYETKEERNIAIKNLTSAPPRLFSAGTNGAIIEWSLSSSLPKKALDSYGGSIWKLSVNNANTTISAATDDGYIRLFDITDGGLTYTKNLEHTKNKILSLCWSEDDSKIFGGSDDGCIRCWDVFGGRIMNRMTANRDSDTITIVWDLIMLNGNILASGDSCGNDRTYLYASGVDNSVIQFRDFHNTKNSKKKFKSSAQPAESILSVTRWIEMGFKRSHSHDVKAISVQNYTGGTVVVSGGVDGQIIVYESRRISDSLPVHFPFFPTQNGVLSFSDVDRLMLMRESKDLKLWKIGQASSESQELAKILDNGTVLEKENDSEPIITIQPILASSIVCSSISPNGRWIALSDNEQVKLFRVLGNLDKTDSIYIKKVENFFNIPANLIKSLENLSKFAYKLYFTKDSRYLVIGTNELLLYVIEMIEDESEKKPGLPSEYKFSVSMVNCQHRAPFDTELKNSDCEAHVTSDNIHVFLKNSSFTLSQDSNLLSPKGFCSINSIASSYDSKYLASSDTSGHITISDLETMSVHSELPNYAIEFSSFPISLIFLENDDSKYNLAIVYSNNYIILWDVAKSSLSRWSVENPPSQFPEFLFSFNLRISNLTIDPSETGVLYAWGSNYVCKIDTNSPIGDLKLIRNVYNRNLVQNEIIADIKKYLLESSNTNSSQKRPSNTNSKKRMNKKDFYKKLARGQTSSRFIADFFDVPEDLPSIPKKTDEPSESDQIGDSKSKTDSHSESLQNADQKVEENLKRIKNGLLSNFLHAGVISESGDFNFSYTRRYQPIMGASFIGPNQLVIAERPEIDVIGILPPALIRKKFGANE
ncbi:Cirhin [Smittium mucronatum]|nr:Cirhin [Smittium mucronatum]